MASAIVSAPNASQRAKWIDLFVRAVVISFFLIIAYSILRDVVASLLQKGNVESIKIASKTFSLVFNMLIAWLILIRSQPLARAKGWQPSVSAIIGSNLFFLGLPFIASKADLPPSVYMASAVLIMVGVIFAIYSLSYLGRSFSIMAQARRLVTDGPYRFLRHPLYLAEFIGYMGIFIQYASWVGAALLIVQCSFQIRRMFNEEALLQSVFPEYTSYMKRTNRVFPGVW